MSRQAIKERRKLDRRRARKGIGADDDSWRNLHGERRKFQRRRVDHLIRPDDGSEDDTSKGVEPSAIENDVSLNDAVAPPGGDATAPQASQNPADARRAALKNMLLASEARMARASRQRLPVLSPGVTVRVIRGEWAGSTGVIEDADYIENRVLLRRDPAEEPIWVPFRRVGHADVED